VSIDEERIAVAGLLRQLGHAFVTHDLTSAQLSALGDQVAAALAAVTAQPLRERVVPRPALDTFQMAVPEEGRHVKHQLFHDSIVSGGANPMGLGSTLWQEDGRAFMEVTLGKAFEGAPGRAHGGIVAALIDETMGLVLAINKVLAFTVQLDITYLAPTPINEAIVAEAWLSRQERRKLFIDAVVRAGETDIAKATAIFVSVDPRQFLEKLPVA